MSENDLHLTFWDHIEELRRTAFKALAVIGLGTALCLYYYPLLFHMITYPLHQASSAPRTRNLLETEKLEKRRIKNVSGENAHFSLPRDAIYVQISSEKVIKQEKGAYFIPPGEFVDYEKPQAETQLVLLSPAEGLTAVLKTSFWAGLLATSPIWLFFILQFIAPALKAKEKKILIPFLAFSLLFLSLGFTFAFFITIPIANQYLAEINNSLGLNFWSLSSYLSYSLLLLFANGFAFEISVILFFLVHFGRISPEAMRRKRKGVIVGIFILSAILTPPDVLTQFLLAIPLMILYEGAILYARMVEKRIVYVKAS